MNSQRMMALGILECFHRMSDFQWLLVSLYHYAIMHLEAEHRRAMTFVKSKLESHSAWCSTRLHQEVRH